MNTVDSIINAAYNNKRLEPHEAVLLFDCDVATLGVLANYRREQIVSGNEVGFVIDRIINYSNRCQAMCKFCAFHAQAGKIQSYDLTVDDILQKIDELVHIGGTQVMLQGGLHPDYTLQDYVAMIKTIKQHYPDIYLHSFSPSEIVHIAKRSGSTIDAIIDTLQQAGLDSIPGASDLLVDDIRKKVSPRKATVAQWCEVVRSIKKHGMHTTATMTYGMGETKLQRIEHLDVIRKMQDETGCIMAFIPWSFAPKGTNMDTIIPATGIDYLKTVAISRIFLDNVPYLHAGWLTEGMALAQIALAMGANDMGGILMEEKVVKATGVTTTTNIPQLCDVIINAGKIPVHRDSMYTVLRRMV
ncbi:MAG TPA: CofH family radical SAM protein [Spirochaetota bacterium]|nr:CofH family radical SAM protein [Spirochaetota bacterium]HOM87338.1 CofH family radical SAM protein [Spirochaetota bacterium]HOR94433.1 CofH family radical SAM protein [Spirochaetota bacterium]HOT19480.1 CofH family radical SAM protein [Spirochaetota bacterium]HPD04549.1 CofH family radical SAM protein [Spirochaetota bacterium]